MWYLFWDRQRSRAGHAGCCTPPGRCSHRWGHLRLWLSPASHTSLWERESGKTYWLWLNLFPRGAEIPTLWSSSVYWAISPDTNEWGLTNEKAAANTEPSDSLAECRDEEEECGGGRIRSCSLLTRLILTFVALLSEKVKKSSCSTIH